jgi:hypothetical protein
LQGTGIDLSGFAEKLAKPLRALWFTPESRVFSDSPADYSDCDFFPVICISASIPVSSPEMQRRSGYTYIQGSGDDHETWSLGLTPRLFWQNKGEILGAGRNECEKVVSQVVQRSKKIGGGTSLVSLPVSVGGAQEISFTRLGNTNIHLGNILAGKNLLLFIGILRSIGFFFSLFCFWCCFFL